MIDYITMVTAAEAVYQDMLNHTPQTFWVKYVLAFHQAWLVVAKKTASSESTSAIPDLFLLS